MNTLETKITLRDIADAKGYQLYGAKAGDYYFPTDNVKRGYGGGFHVTGIDKEIESGKCTVLTLLRAAYESGIDTGRYAAIHDAGELLSKKFISMMKGKNKQ